MPNRNESESYSRGAGASSRKESRAAMKEVKSRKYHVKVNVSDEGIFCCPRHTFRCSTDMCRGRKARRVNGCVTCALPGQIERKK